VNEQDFEGTLVLEKLARIDCVDEFGNMLPIGQPVDRWMHWGMTLIDFLREK